MLVVGLVASGVVAVALARDRRNLRGLVTRLQEEQAAVNALLMSSREDLEQRTADVASLQQELADAEIQLVRAQDEVTELLQSQAR